MKKTTFAVVATLIGVALVKFFWIVSIILVCALVIRFTSKTFRRVKKPKDNKILWQKWEDK